MEREEGRGEGGGKRWRGRRREEEREEGRGEGGGKRRGRREEEREEGRGEGGGKRRGRREEEREGTIVEEVVCVCALQVRRRE